MRVECAKCSRLMVKILQFDQTSADTHLFWCDGCGGSAAVQDDERAGPGPPNELRIETAPEVLEIERAPVTDQEISRWVQGGLDSVELGSRNDQDW